MAAIADTASVQSGRPPEQALVVGKERHYWRQTDSETYSYLEATWPDAGEPISKLRGRSRPGRPFCIAVAWSAPRPHAPTTARALHPREWACSEPSA